MKLALFFALFSQINGKVAKNETALELLVKTRVLENEHFTNEDILQTLHDFAAADAAYTKVNLKSSQKNIAKLDIGGDISNGNVIINGNSRAEFEKN